MKKIAITLWALSAFSVAFASEQDAMMNTAKSGFNFILQSYDANEDKMVSVDEYAAGNFAFMLTYDADKNKEISQEEYLNSEVARMELLSKDNPEGKEVLMKMHEMSKQALPMIYQSFDTDKSGSLSENEFKPLSSMAFQQSDLNRDGQLDGKDLEMMEQMFQAQKTE